VTVAEYTLTIVRGPQPNAVGEELGVSDVDITPGLLDRLRGIGFDDEDLDMWVLVTPVGEDTGELLNVVGWTLTLPTHADEAAGLSAAQRDAITWVNLTPHPVMVYHPDTPDRIVAGSVEPRLVFPTSGRLVRMPVLAVEDHTIEGGVPTWSVGYVDEEPDSMPPIIPGTRYIVPRVVAEAWRSCRRDLRVPHDLVRDMDGAVVGCRALGWYGAGPPAHIFVGSPT
jgi:hypothetical protein